MRQFLPPVRTVVFGFVAALILFVASAAESASADATADRHVLRNISARAHVQVESRVLIGGFIISGDVPKRVLLRAIGPSLTANTAPLAGRLPDPVLELFGEQDAVLARNDNWRDTQEGEIQNTGIAPTHNLESAILRTLEPGRYTAVVRGRNGSSGVGLVEVFDVGGPTSTPLVNLSARATVQPGDDALIGGFIVGGGSNDAHIRVVLRAIGPSLTSRGVPEALRDPTIELVDGNGNRIGFNDNWRDAQELELQETRLAPGDELEAALVATFPSGNYTAVVRGVNGTRGTALVEMYDVPDSRPAADHF